MKRELVCIVCPRGCALEVELNEKEVVSVKGNACKRGEAYAQKECISPERTITTTMKTKDGETVSVKTDRPIPKDKMFELMEIINKEKVVLPISAGDVIIKDVFGCNIVATQNKTV